MVVASVAVGPCVAHGEGSRVGNEALSSVHSDVDRSRHVCVYDVERRYFYVVVVGV
jgi:hypothetical protein